MTWNLVRASGPPTLRWVEELWPYRELLRCLMVRNLKVKYQRSALGFVWTLVNPLLTVLVLAAVFRYVVRITMPHYLVFLLSGYFSWNFLSQTLSAGTYVLAEHAHMSRNVPFPQAIPILAAAGSRLVEFAIELAMVLVGLAIFHHRGIPLSCLILPGLVVLQVLLGLGLAFPVAALSVRYHDVQHILPVVLTILFYLSPVFYPASMVPDWLRSAYLGNPIALLLTAYQTVIYEGRLPSPALLGLLTLVTFTMAWIGYGLFRRHQTLIPELI